MALATLEREIFRLQIQSSAIDPNTWLLQRHDMAGGAGVADQGLEFEGFHIQLHDNGNGTFSITTTTTSDATDVLCEIQGFRIRLHPTGETITIGTVVVPLYAIVVVNV
jgi:hypothetical protein